MTSNDGRHSGHADLQSSLPAASRSWQTQPIQPKPKGLSLGLMLEGTRVARVMRGSPAHAAGPCGLWPSLPLLFPSSPASLPVASAMMRLIRHYVRYLCLDLTSPALGLKPDDLVKRVNGIRVTKEDVGKILRMQWLGGAEPLDLVADRGVHCTACVCVCARAFCAR